MSPLEAFRILAAVAVVGLVLLERSRELLPAAVAFGVAWLVLCWGERSSRDH